MTPETSTALACAACFAVGFIGGFAGGFRVAAMIRLGAQHAPAWVRKLRQDYRDVKRENRQLRKRLRLAASNGELQEDFA
jgi:Flp pilus assembly protein TadB